MKVIGEQARRASANVAKQTTGLSLARAAETRRGPAEARPALEDRLLVECGPESVSLRARGERLREASAGSAVR